MALQRTPPILTGIASVEYVKNDFDAAVWNKGYDIVVEKGIRCPCEGVDGIPLSHCKNCLGTGFFYINPFKTRAIVTGVNSDTQYKEWSIERRGTVALSVIDDGDDRENLSFYDRVTLTSKRNDTQKINSDLSENLEIRNNGVNNFTFLTYKPQQILEVWKFNGSDQPVELIGEDMYSINENNPYVLDLDSSLIFSNNVVSVRYKHDIQYKVIDIPHETRYSTVIDKNGREQTITLPIQAMAARMHLVQDSQPPNYDGSGIIDNSYS